MVAEINAISSSNSAQLLESFFWNFGKKNILWLNASSNNFSVHLTRFTQEVASANESWESYVLKQVVTPKPDFHQGWFLWTHQNRCSSSPPAPILLKPSSSCSPSPNPPRHSYRPEELQWSAGVTCDLTIATNLRLAPFGNDLEVTILSTLFDFLTFLDTLSGASLRKLN